MTIDVAARQAAFNTVLSNLRKQGVASIAADGTSCQYRSEFGCCAVGHLLPPDLDLGPEGNTMAVGALLDDMDLPALESLEYGFLDDLQKTHDCLMPLAPTVVEADRLRKFREIHFDGESRSMAAWEGEMQRIAGYYDLTYEPAP